MPLLENHPDTFASYMISSPKLKNSSYYDLDSPLLIYAPEALGTESAKTAEGVLRYAKNPILAVIDKNHAGKTVREVTGIDSSTPVLATMTEALKLKPRAVLLGTAWSGGGLPQHWRPDLTLALENGLDIINGLHDFLAEDPEFAAAAARSNSRLFDLRRPPENLPVATAKARQLKAFVVLTVGSDCAVGKMTCAIELAKEAEKRSRKAAFVATGQTGIMICGTGIAIDRVIGDFMSGAVEELVMAAGQDNEFIFVEGQGSIVHPSFSGVTLALMHGACPRGLILCHNASRSKIKEPGIDEPILPLNELVSIYERLCSYLNPAKVLGIALNTRTLNQEQTEAALSAARSQTGLPVCDPVKHGSGLLFDAILKHYKEISFD